MNTREERIQAKMIKMIAANEEKEIEEDARRRLRGLPSIAAAAAAHTAEVKARLAAIEESKELFRKRGIEEIEMRVAAEAEAQRVARDTQLKDLYASLPQLQERIKYYQTLACSGPPPRRGKLDCLTKRLAMITGQIKMLESLC